MPAKLSEGLRQRFSHSLATHGSGALIEGVGRFAAPLAARHGLKRRLTVGFNDNEQRIFTPADIASYCTRNSAAWGLDLDGYLVRFDIGQPRLGLSPAGLPSLLKEPQSTNVCTNTNVNPVSLTNVSLTNATNGLATLTIVNDAAELANAKLDKLCTNGNVYKLDNTLGDSAALAVFGGSSTNNTSIWAFSAYVRGSGQCRLGASNQVGAQTALTAGYVRKLDAYQPISSGINSVVYATAGSVVYFILNQLENQNAATSPIAVSGAQVTRSRDNIRIPYAFPDGPITWLFDIALPSTPGVSQAIIIGENNWNLTVTSTLIASLFHRNTVGGGISTQTANTLTIGARAKIAFTSDGSGSRAALCLNGGAVAKFVSGVLGGYVQGGTFSILGTIIENADNSAYPVHYHGMQITRRRISDSQLQWMTQ